MFKFVIIPLLIFLARICDVSLQTMRIVFVSRGMKIIAPLVGFFEVLIWLAAIQQIMQNLNNVVCYVAYAGGFAVGSFVGIHIEKRLALGMSLVRVITNKESQELVEYLRSKDYGVTNIEAEGRKGKVNIIYMIIRRREVAHVIEIIQRFNPKAFFTIEDVSQVSEGIFPQRTSRLKLRPLRPFNHIRKGK